MAGTAIRDFQPEDLAALRHLIYSTIDDCYAGVYPPRACAFFKQYHSEEKILKRSETGCILVAEEGGGLVGTGTVVGNEILGVFVKRECQGKGLGAAIMRELEGRARRAGHKEAELSVSLPSRGFYENLGYEIGPPLTHDVGEGQRLDYWKGKKALQEE